MEPWEPGARFQAAPEALLEEAQAFQAAGEQKNLQVQAADLLDRLTELSSKNGWSTPDSRQGAIRYLKSRMPCSFT